MQVTKFEQITPAQIKKLHVLYRQLGWDEDFKKEQLLRLTEGRTDSTKGLSKSHARYIIEWANEVLNLPDNRVKLRKKVLALCYNAGYIWGSSSEEKAMNYAKIDRFLRERGTVKKNLFEQTEQELKRTIRQFEAMFKHNREKEAERITNQLLQEMNISIQSKF